MRCRAPNTRSYTIRMRNTRGAWPPNRRGSPGSQTCDNTRNQERHRRPCQVRQREQGFPETESPSAHINTTPYEMTLATTSNHLTWKTSHQSEHKHTKRSCRLTPTRAAHLGDHTSVKRNTKSQTRPPIHQSQDQDWLGSETQCHRFECRSLR